MSAFANGRARFSWTPRGAALVEFVVAAPVMLLLGLSIMQIALWFHARSALDYAVYEAARTGAVAHARPADIRRTFERALIPYYGGGRDAVELLETSRRIASDLGQFPPRIERVSPTAASFDDFHSPAAQARLGFAARVIPIARTLDARCPVDVPACAADARANRSGQTLAQSNLLALRFTWSIPASKQLPFVGRLHVWALDRLGLAGGDAYRQAMLDARRIPLVAHVTVRMQSEVVEEGAAWDAAGSPPIRTPDPHTGGAQGSHGGTGSDGPPAGDDPPAPPPPAATCPTWDPTCAICPEGAGRPPCDFPSPACPEGPATCPVCPTADGMSARDRRYA